MSLAEVEKEVQSANRTEIADAIGLDQSHVSLVLSGKRAPSFYVGQEIARQLKVPMDEFCTWHRKKARAAAKLLVEATAAVN